MAKQSDRLLSVSVTGFGADDMLLTGFSGREEISRLFNFQLDLLSLKEKIKGEEIIGKPVSVAIARGEGERYFHGYIRRLTAGPTRGNFRTYRAEMVPWLWFLTQTSDCKVFIDKRDKHPVEIIEEVLKDRKFPNAEVDTSGVKSQRKLEYCVQYRETDFNFVSRMMEQYGIYYYFKHEKDKHTLVLASTPSGYGTCGESKVKYPPGETSMHKEDHVTSWEHQYEFVSGKYVHADYSFKEPSANLVREDSKSPHVEVPQNEEYEIYDFAGEFFKPDDGDREARIRMEEEETPHNVVQGASACKTFTAGHKFALEEHNYEEENQEYLLTAVQHFATEQGYLTGEPLHASYSNTFTCIPAPVAYRPARITPKPVVSGIQTATVVGPKGEEIHTDKYGRVKVHFHWDRPGREKKDDSISCWIRVSHSVAGKKWGFMAIPRIGQEVVVDFIEGDPDRPLIVGSVYNAEQMPHYDLPGDKTKTYIKTNSSKGGKGHNEIQFEDKADDERLYMHAQKNMDVRVLNDSKARIYGNRHQIIGWEKDGKKGGDQREMVYQDKHLNIKRHQVEHIEGNMQLTVGHGDADGGNLDILVEKQKTETIESGYDLHVKGDHKQKIDGGHSLSVSGDSHQKVGGNLAVESGPMNEIHLKAGMKVIIEAGMQVSLKGPGGFINIGPAGVDIQGIMVNINSGGSAGSGSGSSPQDPKDAQKAEPTEAAQAHTSESGMKSAPD